jgi:hypothetical protein
MENDGRLDAQQLKVLSEELVALTQRQSDARLSEVFIKMSPHEVDDFDKRKARICRIYAILWKHDAHRS